MINNILSQETISVLKIGFAQLLTGIIFVGTGVLNFKKNRKFSFVLLIAGLFFIMFVLLFDKVMFSKDNIPGKLNILPMIFIMFMMGIPQILLGIPLAFVGILRMSQPQSKKSGILFLVLASALTFTFVWFLIFFISSDM